jgi:hypothetical protein
MLDEERRGGGDRRKSDSLNAQAPFLTKDGVVFSDRRQRDERRTLPLEEMFNLDDVEEIELKPLRFG